jgi:hypothetical protein
MFADEMLFKDRTDIVETEIEEQLDDDELSFEEAAFLMGYNDFN